MQIPAGVKIEVPLARFWDPNFQNPRLRDRHISRNPRFWDAIFKRRDSETRRKFAETQHFWKAIRHPYNSHSNKRRRGEIRRGLKVGSTIYIVLIYVKDL